MTDINPNVNSTLRVHGAAITAIEVRLERLENTVAQLIPARATDVGNIYRIQTALRAIAEQIEIWIGKSE